MATNVDIQALNAEIENQSAFLSELSDGMHRTIVGQKHLIDALLIGLISNGHILLEGVPGLAKTLAIKTLAQLIDAKFSRIQFTPDLLPADVIGTLVYSQKQETFSVKKGPVFANFLLADEINRAPAKVQSALLEAMQERQVTIGEETFPLPEPFLVLATQNPIEQEGTYKLPEAQLDRFIIKITMGYPSQAEELEILERHQKKERMDINAIKPIFSVQDILGMRQMMDNVVVDANILGYITRIVQNTRNNAEIYLPASPRAAIALLQISKAYAMISGRDFVTPDDVKLLAPSVLSHRLQLTAEAEMEGLTIEHAIRRTLEEALVDTNQQRAMF